MMTFKQKGVLRCVAQREILLFSHVNWKRAVQPMMTPNKHKWTLHTHTHNT